MSLYFSHFTPKIIFGNDCSNEVGSHVTALGGKKVLLVVDPFMTKGDMLSPVLDSLRKESIAVEIFSEVEPEPSLRCIRNSVSSARLLDCDFVIGLGGGSAMDVAKTTAAMLKHEGDIVEYLGANKFTKSGTPTILMPTTAGTGSELGRGALFYVEERRTKESIFSDFMLTNLAMIDPKWTLTCPASVTASSGMDALSHAMESYTNKFATPISMAVAEKAIALLTKWLPVAVNDGTNLVGREQTALGAMFASIALANANTHAVHALAYPLQGANRIPHGVANSVMMPFVFEAISDSASDRFERIAEIMEIDTQNDSVSQALFRLSKEIHLPETIHALGVEFDQIPSFTTHAHQNRRLMNNCPKDLSEDQIRTIFMRAMGN